MNKYTILKSSSYPELRKDESFKICNDLKESLPLSGISSYSIRENLSLSKSSIMTPSTDRYCKLPDIYQTWMPTNTDFLNLLHKLESVTSTKSLLNKDCLLVENELIDLTMEVGSYTYIKIPVKGKKSPLKVKIKKAQGSITVYASSFNQKPSASNYEQIFSQDSFEIRVLEKRFKYEHQFLGIRALTDVKLSIMLFFGKNRIQFIDEKKNPKIKKEILNNEFAESAPIKIKPCKDSIKKFNFEVTHRKRLLSPKELQEKQHEWLNKRKLILLKRKLIQEQKKTNALRYIHRQEIRAQQIEEEKLKIEAKIIQKEKVKEWLTIIYILKGLNMFHEIKTQKRSQIEIRLKRNTRIRTIQRFYKSSSNNLHIYDITIIRAQKLLTLYLHSSYKILLQDQQKKIASAVKASGECKKTIVKFDLFFVKVIKIQKEFKKYFSIRNERMKQIVKYWDECKSFQMRRSLKKKNQVYQISVSISQRAKLLENYYLGCVKKFYLSLRKAPHNMTFLSEVIEDNKDNKEKKKSKISFEYMPSNVVMRSMIEEASLFNEKNAIGME